MSSVVAGVPRPAKMVPAGLSPAMTPQNARHSSPNGAVLMLVLHGIGVGVPVYPVMTLYAPAPVVVSASGGSALAGIRLVTGLNVVSSDRTGRYAFCPPGLDRRKVVAFCRG